MQFRYKKSSLFSDPWPVTVMGRSVHGLCVQITSSHAESWSGSDCWLYCACYRYHNCMETGNWHKLFVNAQMVNCVRLHNIAIVSIVSYILNRLSEWGAAWEAVRTSAIKLLFCTAWYFDRDHGSNKSFLMNTILVGLGKARLHLIGLAIFLLTPYFSVNFKQFFYKLALSKARLNGTYLYFTM